MGGLDPVMGVDNFGRPKTLSETESLVNNILLILFGRPGFYPTIPTLGMDISQYLYNFDDSIPLEALKRELSNQCEDFTDEIDSGDIDILQTEVNGYTCLLFGLPVINDRKTSQLTLGIYINDDGRIIYNFNEVIQEI